MNRENTAPMMSPKVKLEDTNPIVCEKCEGKTFQQVLMLRSISALLTGEGREGIVPITVFGCASCGHVNEQFIPEELKTIIKPA